MRRRWDISGWIPAQGRDDIGGGVDCGQGPPSPLSAIQPEGWLPEYTTDLMNLLHVLSRLVLLEPRQAKLLEQILGEPLLSVADLGLVLENGDESETG